jgi:hypothetical protein
MEPTDELWDSAEIPLHILSQIYIKSRTSNFEGARLYLWVTEEGVELEK